MNTLHVTGHRLPSASAVVAAAKREPNLMRVRMRELDREFARQTKQLTQMTRDLKRKLLS